MASNMKAVLPPLYPELPPGEYIRVLELSPGTGISPLTGKLRTTKLGQSPYTALSYVCGDTTLTHSIHVSGHELGIYKNSFEILCRFRHASETTSVWIDCICINQKDNAEKEREVAFMYKIYETAVSCNIWLGPGDEDSRKALEYARTLDAEACQREYSRHLEFFGNSAWDIKMHILDLFHGQVEKQALINSCARFLLRQWFTRLWCSQEGAVSINTVVYCGNEHIPWMQIFALAWLFLLRQTVDWPDWFETNYGFLESNLFNALNIQRYRLRRYYIEIGNHFTPTSLLISVLQSCAWRQNCYDPRDKIYAMRNIASDAREANDPWPKPDYIITWRQLYTKLALTLAEQGDKDILSLSGTLRQGPDAAMHSWVPDWRRYPRIQYLVHNEWSAGSKSRPLKVKINRIPKKAQRRLLKSLPEWSTAETTPQYTMTLPIFMRDEVAYLGSVVQQLKTLADYQTQRQQILDVDGATIHHLSTLVETTYISAEPVLDAYNATLIANTTDQDQIASATYVADGAHAWRTWLKHGADLSNVPPFHRTIDNMDTFSEKRFGITKAGYFCLVPACTEPTDIIAIVKGMDMPVLLRPVDTYYMYVGDCYIHGMMEFQAMKMIEEFSIKIRDGKAVWKPDGDIRRNGLKQDVGEYKRILETLGERMIELI